MFLLGVASSMREVIGVDRFVAGVNNMEKRSVVK